MKNRRNTLIGLIILVLATVFINIGIMRGEVKTVNHKSTKICLECIGIG